MGYGFYCLIVAFECDEDWGGGEIAIPDVVLYELVVPLALACCGIEGEEAIGEEVVADAV